MSYSHADEFPNSFSCTTGLGSNAISSYLLIFEFRYHSIPSKTLLFRGKETTAKRMKNTGAETEAQIMI